MNHDEILEILEPVIDDAIARLQKRTKADARDVQRIFGPLFESVSRAIGAPAPLPAWEPTDVSLAVVRDAIAAIVKSTESVVTEAQIAERMARRGPTPSGCHVPR